MSELAGLIPGATLRAQASFLAGLMAEHSVTSAQLVDETGARTLAARRDDLPGLIEGAHTGVGLGHEFLRHVERTRVLVHLVEPLPPDSSDPLKNYWTVRRELELHNPKLMDMPEVIAVSKSELTGSEDVRARMEAELRREVLAVSAVTGQGLQTLVNRVAQRLAPIEVAL